MTDDYNPTSGGRKVLLAGASGLVGTELLRQLASDPTVSEIRALVRRPLGEERAYPGVIECIVDFEALEREPSCAGVDQVFCALGTTIRKAGSEEAFRHVDFDHSVAVARAARAGGATHMLLVSSLGADAASKIFYCRVKGELEEEILAMGYRSVTIARPSLLLGDRREFRPSEEIGKLIGWIAPARWRPVRAQQVAACLVRSARTDLPGVHILENSDIRTPARRPADLAGP